MVCKKQNVTICHSLKQICLQQMHKMCLIVHHMHVAHQWTGNRSNERKQVSYFTVELFHCMKVKLMMFVLYRCCQG